MPEKVSAEGLMNIEKKIFELEAKATKGLLNSDSAVQQIKEIRSGLFELVGLIRKEAIIVNDAPGPKAPNAA